jgi:exodeoxyribonuclease V gamma subunit
MDLVLGDFRLSGQLAPRGTHGLLLYRCGKVRPADILRIWIHHLVANILAPGQPCGFLGEDAFHSYRPPEDPRPLLIELLELYWRGLSEPLKFFPKSSFAFVEAEQKRSQPTKAKSTSSSPLAKALGVWEGNAQQKRAGEKDDPYISLCFQHVEPLDEDFIAIARRVFQPVLAHEHREEF